MNKFNPDGQLVIEQPFLRIPHEQTKKAYRLSQKYLEKDLAFVNNHAGELVKQAKKQQLASRAQDGSAASSSATAHKLLDSMLNRLTMLKRKLSDTKADETMYLHRSKLRSVHLNELCTMTSTQDPGYEAWSHTRLNRLLVDYMFRKGYHQSATKLAHDQTIRDFADFELFRESATIEQSLRDQNCAKCLQWCSDNKSALRKVKSSLEFDLHLQEFIELARSQQTRIAIQYAKKHLLPWSETHQRQIEQAMGLLAFSALTTCEPYKQLYDTSRWQHLIDHFRTDNFSLNALADPAPLLLTLQTGLSALKCHHCYHDEDRNINCPVCQTETLGKLAESLPYSHQVNSNLVCRISGHLMNEDNPPMKLPNGRVYSYQSLQAMAVENNGEVKCPVTGQEFLFSEAKKLFIS
ncbi:CTLH/CRA C-terminal to lish motif domain-containing protein [Dimargaris cristalligena]|uniref:CTLH/CRA C-terminal to lish motif domain-containing protein n=1 Tax=Dimargaris cristalligena TaxID=215637 RepID=A0A4Q0A4M0_9FUNG|nr:CTLH/CRA C-terminal to lish motif domain-containing protein [Dimargaris cristalligena]|eukprot:RKP40200.1 CTLH/CRA C-terminal to lish motif domain-containing protein [Dimargaris cristalligena]